MSTYPEAVARLEEFTRKLVIELSVNLQPFLEAMQRVALSFAKFAGAFMACTGCGRLGGALSVRGACDNCERAAAAFPLSALSRRLNEAMRAPYRVKRGRGQRRNRRNR